MVAIGCRYDASCDSNAVCNLHHFQSRNVMDNRPDHTHGECPVSGAGGADLRGWRKEQPDELPIPTNSTQEWGGYENDGYGVEQDTVSAKGFLKWDGTVNIAMVAILVSAVLAYGVQQAQSNRTHQDVIDHESRIRTLEGQSERLSRIETHVTYTTEALSRIERRMESR